MPYEDCIPPEKLEGLVQAYREEVIDRVSPYESIPFTDRSIDFDSLAIGFALGRGVTFREALAFVIKLSEYGLAGSM